MTTNDELLKILEKNRDASSQQKIPESSTTIPTTTTTNTITNDELLKILNSNQPSEVQSFTGEYKIDKGGPDKSELMRYGWALETNSNETMSLLNPGYDICFNKLSISSLFIIKNGRYN